MMMNPVRFVLWVVLTVMCAPGALGPIGESDVVGSNEPVRAKVGNDVVLLCHVHPPADVTDVTVEWKYNTTTVVHMYKSRGDNSDSQNDIFRNRTSLFHKEMTKGNISLKLVNVTEADAGYYTCSVRKEKNVKKGNVTLIVDPAETSKKHEGPILFTATGPETEAFNWTSVYIGVGVPVAATVIIAGVLLQRYRRKCCSGQNQSERQDDAQIRSQEGTPLNDIGNH